ncbi:hypothetical protein GCM10020218_012260 [Dactylosporangium vinaceum]
MNSRYSTQANGACASIGSSPANGPDPASRMSAADFSASTTGSCPCRFRSPASAGANDARIRSARYARTLNGNNPARNTSDATTIAAGTDPSTPASTSST